MRRLLATLLLAVAGPSFAVDLSSNVNDRLGYMRDVAAHKWIGGLPIEDKAREAVVIRQATLTGLQYGIETAATKRFFSLQITAAKEIQQYWFDRWEKRGAPESAPDLVTEVRPALLELGDRIMASLGDQSAGKDIRVNVRGVSRETAAALAAAARDMRYYPDRFDQVIESGILRVGTTGDYAPFSFAKDGDPFVGIDVDLAGDLASSLGVELRLVQTSWPTLMADLEAGRYDIAMSGVSRSLARAKTGFFSEPYHVGGKTPIIRCEDRDRFASFEDIDREGTRAIVNPGGTNNRFATAQLKSADLAIHPDNRTIFDEIIEGRADVMFTDAIEVRLKTAQHPELCAALPGITLTYQEKGYLMPPDERLRQYVNLWLSQRKGDGTLEAVVLRHLTR